MRITMTVRSVRGTSDIVVDCDPELPVERLYDALAVEAGAGEARPAGHDPASETLVAEAGLHNGEVLRLDGSAPDPAPPISGWQLAVVGGPGAGSVFSLPLGMHELGRSGMPSWNDRSMSRRHCLVEVGADSVAVRDLGSSNGSWLDAESVSADEATPWQPCALLRIGDSLLELREAVPSDAVLEEAEPGWLNFLRPPRIAPLHLTPTVKLPKAPGEHKARRIPIVAVVAPMLVGFTMAAVMRNPFYLMFAFMSPVMMLANFISDRRGSARDHREAVEEYTTKLAAAQQELTEKLDAEQKRLRFDAPDAAATLMTAVRPGRRLWERRKFDSDSLLVRLGSADIDSTVVVEGADEPLDHKLRSVPVGVTLSEVGVLGLAGPSEQLDGLLRWCVTQLATYHAPRDLSISFVSLQAGPEWNWLRWLPQLRPDDLDAALAHVANDQSTVTSMASALHEMVKERQDYKRDNGNVTAESFPTHVVVLHGYRELRAVPGIRQLLEQGPEVGVYAICTETDERSLPERARATMSLNPEQPAFGSLLRTGAARLGEVLADTVSQEYAERLARALAPLKDIGADIDGDLLPDSARLLEVVNLEHPTAEGIRSRWVLEPRSTKMVLGIGNDGPFSLDLAGDGPHGLVAGMTGSGKTELLQTMIASLAIANRPDALNFVLVDYKGDSAFKECVKLPHTVGKVNDLDPHLVTRALASLTAELKYREHFLAEAQVKDIEDYQDLCLREPHRDPLPRLLIVIDEFAQLSKDLPEFVSGLVSIAQLGRSLGIHLVLATQRPSGVVSPEIRANTNLRIALRVAEVSDSQDIIGAPDSARIPKSAPGRAFARTGASSLQGFQAGRVGGRRPGSQVTEVPAPFVSRVTWEGLAYATPRPTVKASSEVADTDLAALVSAIVEAGEQDGVAKQRSPWLPALPETLLSAELLAGQGPRAGEIVPLIYGRIDLPDRQEQRPVAFDLERDGHLLVIGSAKSGRSQVLRALAASIASLTTADDVHLYGLDCGNGALNPLVDLPHCGAVVSRTEPERAARLLSRLTEVMDQRQATLSSGGFGDISEQRAASDDPLPHIVVMLDRWEGFTTTIGEVDALFNAVTRILREGASLGVHAVITGDRTLAGNSRVATMTENKLALRLADRGDFTLVGLSPRNLPDTIQPGRGFTPDANEVQVMLLAADSSGAAQTAALRELAGQAQPAHEGRRPFRLDVLPARPTLEQALALPSSTGSLTPRIPIGVGGDDLMSFEVDYQRGSSFIVGGPGRSGRSSVLASAARGFLTTGGQVITVAPRPGELREVTGDGVLAAITDPTTPVSVYEAALEGATGPVLLLLDDGEQLRDSGGSDFFLEVARGRREGVFLLVAGNVDGLNGGISGWNVEARKARQGLLLSPQGLADGDLIGIRLARNLVGAAVRPGRGWLHLGDGELHQVATIG